MADRIAALVILVVAGLYGLVAFTAIKAPFQYDPLGPESWPQILSIAAMLCALAVLARPDAEPDWGGGSTLGRLGLALAALVVYAIAFQPLGFLVSTFLFCAGLAWRGGAGAARALLFGLGIAVGGDLLCTRVLELNLPAGVLGL